MTDLISSLGAAGIALRRIQPGNHRAPCPRCDRGPRDDALGVTIDADGAFVAHCFRCDWRIAWRPREAAPERPAAILHHRMRRDAAHGRPDLSTWRDARPIAPDCPVGRYLIGRGCALPCNHVRWRPGQHGGFPEMVALITDAMSGQAISLHTTFIARDGIGKAPVARTRKYLAGHRKAGGVVRLHPDEAVTTGLTIGEGLETCLTAALDVVPVWACLDASNLAAFPVLPGVETLTVLVDHDDAGMKATAAVRQRWGDAGRDVVQILSPMPGEDFNDWMRRRGAA